VALCFHFKYHVLVDILSKVILKDRTCSLLMTFVTMLVLRSLALVCGRPHGGKEGKVKCKWGGRVQSRSYFGNVLYA